MPARAVLRFAWTISFALVLITFSGLPSSLARSLYARAASRSVSKVPRYSPLPLSPCITALNLPLGALATPLYPEAAKGAAYMLACIMLRFALAMSSAVAFSLFTGLPSSLARLLYAMAPSRAVSKVPKCSQRSVAFVPCLSNTWNLLPNAVTPV